MGAVGRGAVTVAILVSCACACAADTEDTQRDPQKAPEGVGCVQILAVGEGANCLVEWACADAGSQALACGERDGGVTCACTLDETAPVEVTGPATGCGTQPFEKAGQAICGWKFE